MLDGGIAAGRIVKESVLANHWCLLDLCECGV